jgi:hypothetical protein
MPIFICVMSQVGYSTGATFVSFPDFCPHSHQKHFMRLTSCLDRSKVMFGRSVSVHS